MKFKLPKIEKKYQLYLYLLVLFLPILIYFFYIFNERTLGVGNGYTASFVLGQENFTSNVAQNIYPAANSLKYQSDLAVDSTNHKLYVVDQLNYRILVYNLDTGNNLIDSVADNVLGKSDFTSSNVDLDCYDGTPTAEIICGGEKLAVDPESQLLFVSQFGLNRIVIYDVSTIVNNENAVGVLGQSDFTTNTPATTQSGLNQPDGIDFDTVNDRLFVADNQNARIMVMNFNPESWTSGQNFDFVLGRANFTTGGSCPITSSTSLCHPSDVKFDTSSDKLYVADYYYNRVLVYDGSVANLSNGDAALNVLGQSNFSGYSKYGGLTFESPTGFDNPLSIDIDETSDLLFVGDSAGRVYVFDVATLGDNEDAVYLLGKDSFSEALGCTSYTADSLCTESYLTYSTNDLLYVSDRYSSRILLFDVSSITNGEDAVGLIGQSTYLTNYPNYISNPNVKGFETPMESEFDYINNRIFSSDYDSNRVLVFNTDSNGVPLDNTADYVIGQVDFNTSDQSCVVTSSSICYPEGLELDPEGERLFLADSSNNRVLVYDISPENMENGMAASYVLGQTDFVSSNYDFTATTLDYPARATYDRNSQILYVSDSNNNRVLGYDLSDGITDGMAATRVLGQSNFTSNDADFGENDVVANGFNWQYDVELDLENEKLYVSDNGNCRVLVFDVSTEGFSNGLSAQKVLGTNSFTDGSCPQLHGVAGISVDEKSRLLYLADYSDDRVLVFDIDSINNGELPIAVIGQQDFNGLDCNQDTGSPFAYTLCQPYGVGINPENGNILISEYNNSRLLGYNFARITETSVANGDSGVAYNQALTVTNDQGDVTISVFEGTLPPGLSVSGSSITGTPTTTGTYNFTLEVSDDNGSNGVFRQLQEFTILIDPELIDTDGDGITDVIEQASPNSGDANNDNTDDDQQDNVTSIMNPLTNNYTTVESNCNSNNNVDVDPNTGDTAFSYPYGMIEFTITCTNPGDSATIELYFFEPEDANSYVLRKFDGTDYDTVGDYSIQELTIGGESVIKVTYNIIDGGVLDQDGVANGTIVDPVGLAENSVGTPNTGLGGAK